MQNNNFSFKDLIGSLLTGIIGIWDNIGKIIDNSVMQILTAICTGFFLWEHGSGEWFTLIYTIMVLAMIGRKGHKTMEIIHVTK